MRQIIIDELLDAIDKGETTRFKRLLYGRGRRKGLNGHQLAVAVDLNTRLSDGSMLLHKAVQFERAEIVRILIRAGVKLNARWRSTKRTALHIAARNNSYEIARMLIIAGASVNTRDFSGKTPLKSASEKYGYESAIFNLLYEAGAKYI